MYKVEIETGIGTITIYIDNVIKLQDEIDKLFSGEPAENLKVVVKKIGGK
jgi:hypothetical protein